MYIKNATSIFDYKSIVSKIIKSLILGIVIGTITSCISAMLGIYIEFSDDLILLLPISLMLYFVRSRYLCLAYSSAVLGLVSFIFNGQYFYGIKLFDIKTDVIGLIGMVGILHFAEAMFILFLNHKEAIPMVINKNNKTIAVYKFQNYWLLPFILVIIKKTDIFEDYINIFNNWPLFDKKYIVMYSIFTVLTLIGYSNFCISTPIKTKLKNSFLSLLIYSLCMIFIYLLRNTLPFVKFIGIILMPALHEYILLQDIKNENNNKPIYCVPDKGIRILDFTKNSIFLNTIAEKGDIIIKINNEKIYTYDQFKILLQQSKKKNRIYFELLDINNKVKKINIKNKKKINIGIVPLLEWSELCQNSKLCQNINQQEINHKQ